MNYLKKAVNSLILKDLFVIIDYKNYNLELLVGNKLKKQK